MARTPLTGSVGRVLVTGGAGCLGSVLCGRLLDAGHAVTVLDNLAYRQHSLLHLAVRPQFEFVPGDARDEPLVWELLRSDDVIVPLAALVGAPACDRDPERNQDAASSATVGR